MAKIGFELLKYGVDFEEVREFVVEAEAMGFDSIWTADNIIWKDHVTGEYEPVYEAWTLLAAVAEASDKIRIGSMVTPCRRRHPALLAKMISTVDIISKGRLNVGLGTGDIESHFELWGMTLPSASERIKILREEIKILKKLWTEDKVSFSGNYYTLNQAVNNPQPLQKPHPPIWLGLVLGRTLMPQLVAECADALNVYTGSDKAAVEHLENVERYCDEIDRDFSTIHKSRAIFVFLSEDGKNIPTVEQNFLTATLKEQFDHIKNSSDSYQAYKRVTQRHVVGTPEQVAEELIKILDLGFEHLTIGGVNTLSSLELFAKEVLPIIKSR